MNKSWKKTITKEFLQREYVVNKKSKYTIANEIGCSHSMIDYYMEKFNIHYRTRAEAQTGKPGHRTTHGEFTQQHYCNCGNPICYNTWKYGSGLCSSCANSGINNPMFGVLPTAVKKIKYKNIWMRSSWEAKYAKWLDKQGIEWEYESKTFDLGSTTYTPDFYLPIQDKYIEIKGRWLNNSKQKFTQFKKLYPSLKIDLLMQEQLKKSRIL